MTVRLSDDLAAAFARLGGEEDSTVWGELWDDLCHQGDVYEDSFLALPYLEAIAGRRAPGGVQDAVLMAGLIASAADDEHSARYAAEINAFLPVARRLLDTAADDRSSFVYLLQCLLAFEGERVWSAGRLEGLFYEEYEVDCPVCESALFIAFGDHGTFASAGDYVTADPVKTALLPADPAALGPLPARLHRIATEAGHEEVARGLTHLFGRATCPDCAGDFVVSEQVECR
ncbi:hypothetical protein EF910_17855 [Streptomyces sp. WAC07149]|uniref:hypothetical protein n=1 Tax=Streptomyces sp. WAC07149 TaxID=2487425 RepID=UPI000F79B263|nr:hypothetical protein [Streptomyces sp. WAC07149]RST04394.1 hypothetical protein EF910_17855 [Streptomyces sp. WAC07149]